MYVGQFLMAVGFPILAGGLVTLCLSILWLGQLLLWRAAITSKEGIVPPRKVLEALGQPASDWNPGMPEWVRAWAEAEELRPWDGSG